MQVERITYETFKGVTDAMVAEKLNLLVGGNGTGKTARMLGPEFAVMGTTPAGDRPEAALKYGGPSGMAVTMKLDNGFTWTRAVRRDPIDMGAKSHLSIVGQEDLKVRKADSEVKKTVGDFAVMFDLGEFLSLSDDKRRDYVLNLCSKARGDATLDANDICMRIYVEVLKAHLGEGTVIQAAEGSCGSGELDTLSPNERKELVHLLAPKLPEGWCDALGDALAVIREEIKGEMTVAIGAALAKSKDVASSHKKAADESDKAVRHLSDQKNALGVVAETTQQLKSRLAELRDKKEEAATTMATEAEREEARAAARDAQVRLDQELARLAEQLKGATDSDTAGALERATELEAEADELDKKADPPLQDVSTPEHAVRDANESHREARTALREAERANSKATGAEDDAKRALERAETDPWRTAAQLMKQLDEAIGKAKGAVRTRADALGQYLADMVGNATTVEELKEAMEDAAKAAKKTREDLRNAISEADRCAKQIDKTQGDLDHCRATNRETERNGNRARAQAYDKRDRAAKLRRNASGGTEEATRIQAAIKAKTEERDNRKGELSELGSGGQDAHETAKAARSGAEAQIAELETSIEAKNKHASLEAALTSTIHDAAMGKVAHEACEAVTAGIKKLRDGLVAELVMPVLRPINSFLASSGAERTAYCRLLNDRDRPIFELGWSDGERNIPLEALSGGEGALFGAALAYALVRLADPPLKLLLLEGAELDSRNLGRVLDALHTVQDDLDNVFVATCNAGVVDDAKATGWNVVDLARSEATAEVTA